MIAWHLSFLPFHHSYIPRSHIRPSRAKPLYSNLTFKSNSWISLSCINRLLALIAFLCWCAVKHHTNKQNKDRFRPEHRSGKRLEVEERPRSPTLTFCLEAPKYLVVPLAHLFYSPVLSLLIILKYIHFLTLAQWTEFWNANRLENGGGGTKWPPTSNSAIRRDGT